MNVRKLVPGLRACYQAGPGLPGLHLGIAADVASSTLSFATVWSLM